MTRYRERARRVSPQETAELWPRVMAAYTGYGSYQRRTERDIPLVICERAERPPRLAPPTAVGG
jgi:hypothetical protein